MNHPTAWPIAQRRLNTPMKIIGIDAIIAEALRNQAIRRRKMQLAAARPVNKGEIRFGDGTF